MMPDFVVDLPGGGGKRLASTFETYDPATGKSTWRAPGLPGSKGEREYQYFDPRPLPQTVEQLQQLRVQQDLMHKHKSTRLEDFMKDDTKVEAMDKADHEVQVAVPEPKRGASDEKKGVPSYPLSTTTFPPKFTQTTQPDSIVSLYAAPPRE